MSSIFFLGATGQVGGPLLTTLRQTYPTYPITALVRSNAYDASLAALKIDVVAGTFEDAALVTSLVLKHDIIINVADSRSAPLTQSILDGCLSSETRKTLLHMSGAGSFVDGRKDGMRFDTNAPVFDDSNPEQVKGINSKMPPNGPADELILAAASKGLVNAYIVTPGGIYGSGKGNKVLKDDGSKTDPLGVWVGWCVANVENLGFSPYVGDGGATFFTVHVDDVVALTITVFEHALATTKNYLPEDVFSNYFLAVDERHDWKTLSEAFAQLLFRQGKIAQPTVKSVPFEEAGTVARYIGNNIMVAAKNAQLQLGWKPKAEGILEVLERM